MVATLRNPFRAALKAVGEALGDLAGKPVTRLKAPHAVGATTLDVESVYRFNTAGSLWVGDEPRATAYTGVVATANGQQFTGCTPLTRAHREDTEVADANRAFSALDRCWRALHVAYALGRDLDRVGGNQGIHRPRGVGDTIYRAMIEVLSYLPRAPVYSLEVFLAAVYPGGGWTIFEDLQNSPSEVFITAPGYLGTAGQGRSYMGHREAVTSSTTTSITLADDPALVRSVKLVPVQHALAMDDLPSAEGWTFDADTTGLEATYFNIATGKLHHAQTAGDAHGGRYLVQPAPSSSPGKFRFEVYWMVDTISTANGYPWKLIFEDGEREMGLIWNATHVALGQSNDTALGTPVAWTPGSTIWHHMVLEREGNEVRGWVDGQLIAQYAPASFNASSNRMAQFGYWNNGGNQNWSVLWDNLTLYVTEDTEYWNLKGEQGQTSSGSDNFTDSTANPFVAGDANKLIRVVDENTAGSKVNGLWKILAHVNPSTVQLGGITRINGYTSVLNPTSFYSSDPVFTPFDVTKIITVATGPNAGPHTITAWVSEHEVVCAGSSFVTDTDTSWSFDPAFATQGALNWELIAAGDEAGGVLTLREGLPEANSAVVVDYAVVKSAELMKDENIVAHTDQRPLALWGVDQWIQDLAADITAAGVIATWKRRY